MGLLSPPTPREMRISPGIYLGGPPAANFPLINPIQRTAASNIAGFVMKVNPTGTTLLFSSFFNGLGGLSPASVAVDNAGAMYVTGGVYGASLPVVGAFQPLSPTTNEIPFISKISLAGASGIAFVPGAITFGSVYVGYTSAAQEVTLLAAGNQDLLLNSITASPSSYAVTSNCPPDLTGGSSWHSDPYVRSGHGRGQSWNSHDRRQRYRQSSYVCGGWDRRPYDSHSRSECLALFGNCNRDAHRPSICENHQHGRGSPHRLRCNVKPTRLCGFQSLHCCAQTKHVLLRESDLHAFRRWTTNRRPDDHGQRRGELGYSHAFR